VHSTVRPAEFPADFPVSREPASAGYSLTGLRPFEVYRTCQRLLAVGYPEQPAALPELAAD